jgi:hypothetical protein
MLLRIQYFRINKFDILMSSRFSYWVLLPLLFDGIYLAFVIIAVVNYKWIFEHLHIPFKVFFLSFSSYLIGYVVAGIFRDKTVKVEIKENAIIFRRFLGLGSGHLYSFSDLDGYQISSFRLAIGVMSI